MAVDVGFGASCASIGWVRHTDTYACTHTYSGATDRHAYPVDDHERKYPGGDGAHAGWRAPGNHGLFSSGPRPLAGVVDTHPIRAWLM